KEFSERLLPWLGQMGCDNEIDEIQRHLLETSLGRLGKSLKIDAYWAGERAMFFCWMLGLVPPLEDVKPADLSNLPHVLHILKPSASEIIRSASLRARSEIENACRHVILIRSMFHESRVEGVARDIVRKVNVR